MKTLVDIEASYLACSGQWTGLDWPGCLADTVCELRKAKRHWSIRLPYPNEIRHNISHEADVWPDFVKSLAEAREMYASLPTSPAADWASPREVANGLESPAERTVHWNRCIQAFEELAEQEAAYVESRAALAEEYAWLALEAAKAGEWEEAMRQAELASNVELEFGDDPVWGPFADVCYEVWESYEQA